MSMYSDWIADYEYEMDHPHGNPDTTKWKTKDGRVLNVCDMTTEHIKNCMNMIGEENPYWWPFAKELLKRVGVKV